MSRLIILNLWLIFISLLISTNSFAQLPFQKTFGHANGNSHGNAIILTNTGDYAIAGWYDVDGLFSAEFYMILLDVKGDTIWAKTYGEKTSNFNGSVNGSGNEGFNIIQTADNGFMLIGERHKVSDGSSDVYAVKLDNSGVLQWSRTYGGTSIDAATDMQVTSDGGFILIGYSFSFGAGSSDVYVIRTNAKGEILWQHTYGGELNDIGYSVMVTQDGGFMLCGETESFGAGLQDIYLTKLNLDGDVEWTRAYGGENVEAANSIIQVEDGGYIAAGYTRGFGAERNDFFLMKTDAEGEIVWSKKYGGSSDEAAQSVKQTQDGGFILTGYTRSFGLGNSEVYLIKTDSEGNGGCVQSNPSTQAHDIPTIKTKINSSIGSGAESSPSITLVGNTHTVCSDPCKNDVGSKDNSRSQAIEIYPNPTSNYLTISTSDKISFIGKQVKIYDILGQLMKNYKLINSVDKIDISKLPNGVYFLTILMEDQYVSIKFVKN